MRRILLIDDDPAFTRFLAEYIADNYPLLQVEICNNPMSALHSIKVGRYDLMLIDLEMPAMDGIKLLKFAVSAGMDKNRIVILSGRDADFLHGICPMGTCLAVLNKLKRARRVCLIWCSTHSTGRLKLPDLKVQVVFTQTTGGMEMKKIGVVLSGCGVYDG